MVFNFFKVISITYVVFIGLVMAVGCGGGKSSTGSSEKPSVVQSTVTSEAPKSLIIQNVNQFSGMIDVYFYDNRETLLSKETRMASETESTLLPIELPTKTAKVEVHPKDSPDRLGLILNETQHTTISVSLLNKIMNETDCKQAETAEEKALCSLLLSESETSSQKEEKDGKEITEALDLFYESFASDYLTSMAEEAAYRQAKDENIDTRISSGLGLSANEPYGDKHLLTRVFVYDDLYRLREHNLRIPKETLPFEPKSGISLPFLKEGPVLHLSPNVKHIVFEIISKVMDIRELGKEKEVTTFDASWIVPNKHLLLSQTEEAQSTPIPFNFSHVTYRYPEVKREDWETLSINGFFETEVTLLILTLDPKNKPLQQDKLHMLSLSLGIDAIDFITSFRTLSFDPAEKYAYDETQSASLSAYYYYPKLYFSLSVPDAIKELQEWGLYDAHEVEEVLKNWKTAEKASAMWGDLFTELYYSSQFREQWKEKYGKNQLFEQEIFFSAKFPFESTHLNDHDSKYGAKEYGTPLTPEAIGMSDIDFLFAGEAGGRSNFQFKLYPLPHVGEDLSKQSFTLLWSIPISKIPDEILQQKKINKDALDLDAENYTDHIVLEIPVTFYGMHFKLQRDSFGETACYNQNGGDQLTEDLPGELDLLVKNSQEFLCTNCRGSGSSTKWLWTTEKEKTLPFSWAINNAILNIQENLELTLTYDGYRAPTLIEHFQKNENDEKSCSYSATFKSVHASSNARQVLTTDEKDFLNQTYKPETLESILVRESPRSYGGKKKDDASPAQMTLTSVDDVIEDSGQIREIFESPQTYRIVLTGPKNAWYMKNLSDEDKKLAHDIQALDMLQLIRGNRLFSAVDEWVQGMLSKKIPSGQPDTNGVPILTTLKEKYNDITLTTSEEKMLIDMILISEEYVTSETLEYLKDYSRVLNAELFEGQIFKEAVLRTYTVYQDLIERHRNGRFLNHDGLLEMIWGTVWAAHNFFQMIAEQEGLDPKTIGDARDSYRIPQHWFTQKLSELEKSCEETWEKNPVIFYDEDTYQGLEKLDAVSQQAQTFKKRTEGVGAMLCSMFVGGLSKAIDLQRTSRVQIYRQQDPFLSPAQRDALYAQDAMETLGYWGIQAGGSLALKPLAVLGKSLLRRSSNLAIKYGLKTAEEVIQKSDGILASEGFWAKMAAIEREKDIMATSGAASVQGALAPSKRTPANFRNRLAQAFQSAWPFIKNSRPVKLNNRIRIFTRLIPKLQDTPESLKEFLEHALALRNKWGEKLRRVLITEERKALGLCDFGRCTRVSPFASTDDLSVIIEALKLSVQTGTHEEIIFLKAHIKRVLLIKHKSSLEPLLAKLVDEGKIDELIEKLVSDVLTDEDRLRVFLQLGVEGHEFNHASVFERVEEFFKKNWQEVGWNEERMTSKLSELHHKGVDGIAEQLLVLAEERGYRFRYDPKVLSEVSDILIEKYAFQYQNDLYKALSRTRAFRDLANIKESQFVAFSEKAKQVFEQAQNRLRDEISEASLLSPVERQVDLAEQMGLLEKYRNFFSEYFGGIGTIKAQDQSIAINYLGERGYKYLVGLRRFGELTSNYGAGFLEGTSVYDFEADYMELLWDYVIRHSDRVH